MGRGALQTGALHNLFVTSNGQHAVQFINSSTDNLFAQNLLLGVALGALPLANPDALLLEVDASVDGNQYTRNAYVGGRIEGRDPGADELRETALDAAWFTGFPSDLEHATDGFAPLAAAPWASAGDVLPDAPADMRGAERTSPTSLGPLAP